MPNNRLYWGLIDKLHVYGQHSTHNINSPYQTSNESKITNSEDTKELQRNITRLGIQPNTKRAEKWI